MRRSYRLESEADFKRQAAAVARSWLRLEPPTLLVGLRGDLGTGKTTWVRGMLDALGYEGRVPSPTYTLLEQYLLENLSLVHVDLYRLPGTAINGNERELESLGLRDWLANDRTWLLVEWPERAPALEARCDIVIDFGIAGEEGRTVVLEAHSTIGKSVLRGLAGES